MNENNQQLNWEQAATYAVNAIAQCATELGRQGIPNALIIYALSVNQAMGLKMTLDASFAALKAEPSEGQKGG